MRKKNKQKTITQHYLETLCVSLIIMVFLSVTLITKDRASYKTDVANQESAVMANSTVAYYSYLISVLLRGDLFTLNQYLEQIKLEERLTSVAFVEPGSKATATLEKCYSYTPDKMMVGYIPSCHFLEGDQVWVIQEFISGSRTVGYFIKARSLHLISPLQYAIKRPLLSLWLLFMLLFGIYYMRQLHKHIVRPLTFLSRKAKKLNLDEIKDYKLHEVHHLAHTLAQAQHELIAQSKLAATGQIAMQVAHDICSPLSSIQAALGYLEQMKIEDPKSVDVLNLLQLSTKRLTGIANDLLKKHKGDVALPGRFSIHQILDELIGEFQAQDRFQQIEFVKEYSLSAIYLDGNVAKIQRAFGNIIKNGAEAMQFSGKIILHIEENREHAVIAIRDTGPGMTPEKLERVLQGGFTEGKDEGHGIGMKVVKETIGEHGGKVWGKSIVGEGTTFFVEFANICHKNISDIFILTVFAKEPILVVDDDPSLREQWKLVLKEQGVQAILCDSMEELQKQNISSHFTQTAIVDYHFDNSEKNGADIVQFLKKSGFENLVLCTAEYWKPSIQKLAKELGVSMCPKPLPTIKVEYIADKKQTAGLKVLVVDDDEAIRSAWELVQNKLKIKQLYCYPNLEALQQNGTNLSEIDLAFVDKNIQDSAYNGAEVIEYLSKKEVKKIVLASGENADVLRKDPQYSKAHHFIDEKIPRNLEVFLS